jgi:hypothetical protein
MEGRKDEMKILFTGYTAQQIGNGTRLGYGPVADLFAEALRDAGCTVEHRPVEPDESLKDYDCLIVGQAPLHALGSNYAYPALHAIARARSEGCGLMFYLDDWQIPNLMSGVRTVCKEPKRLVKGIRKEKGNDDPSTFVYKRHRDWAVQHLDTLMLTVNAMKDRPWPATFVPKFAWGDPTSLVKPLNSKEFVYVDVSPYTAVYDTVIPPDNERYGQWVLGILSDQREWTNSLGLKWPIQYIGSKKSKAPVEPMKEWDLVQLYANNWGVLSPPYSHAGSGWWRNRFVYAARTRSILLGSPAEVSCIGDAYTIPVDQIEGSGIPRLREIADGQRDQLLKWEWSKEQCQTVMLDAVKKAISEI